MDEKTRQFLTQINTKLDDLLDLLAPDREDIDNTRGHLIYTPEDSLTLGKRITNQEEEIRRARRDGQT